MEIVRLKSREIVGKLRVALAAAVRRLEPEVLAADAVIGITVRAGEVEAVLDHVAGALPIGDTMWYRLDDYETDDGTYRGNQRARTKAQYVIDAWERIDRAAVDIVTDLVGEDVHLLEGDLGAITLRPDIYASPLERHLSGEHILQIASLVRAGKRPGARIAYREIWREMIEWSGGNARRAAGTLERLAQELYADCAEAEERAHGPTEAERLRAAAAEARRTGESEFAAMLAEADSIWSAAKKPVRAMAEAVAERAVVTETVAARPAPARGAGGRLSMPGYTPPVARPTAPATPKADRAARRPSQLWTSATALVPL